MTTATLTRKRLPPLQHGDTLDRREFHRRYRRMTGVKKAELIEGEVYMPSPVSAHGHAKPDFYLTTLFGLYSVSTKQVSGGANATLKLGPKSEVQPDSVLYILPECGGQAELVRDFFVKAPDLVAEISASSISIDLHKKKRLYERFGVREYVVVRTYDQAIDAFTREGEQLIPIAPDKDGVLRSRIFPGLWLDVPAFIAGDFSRCVTTLNRGLASAEHAQFIDAALGGRS